MGTATDLAFSGSEEAADTTSPADAGSNLSVAARDGYPLAATLYGRDTSSRWIIIHGATAVGRRFYRRFAAYLADAGYQVLTYDYRGVGGSRPDQLRGFEASMRDWALLDMAGVVDWVRSQYELERLLFVGHSFGGQAAGLLDSADGVDGMITLSAQSGHWRLQGGEQKLAVAFHVYVTLPLLSAALGYMPWSWLGASEDLPKGVALEWSRWCRHPRYLLGDASLPLGRYATFTAPVLAYSLGDDKWGTPAAVDAMMSAYPNLERRHVEPSAIGLRGLGHFGYFREGSEPLWRDAVAWLNER